MKNSKDPNNVTDRLLREAKSLLEEIREYQGLDQKFKGEKIYKEIPSFFGKDRIYLGEGTFEKKYFESRSDTLNLSDEDFRNKYWEKVHVGFDSPFIQKIHEVTSFHRGGNALPIFSIYWQDRLESRKITEEEYNHILNSSVKELRQEAKERESEFREAWHKRGKKEGQETKVNYLSVQLQNRRTLISLARDLQENEFKTFSKRKQNKIKRELRWQMFHELRDSVGLKQIDQPVFYPLQLTLDKMSQIMGRLQRDPRGFIGLSFQLQDFFNQEFQKVVERYITQNWTDEKFLGYCRNENSILSRRGCLRKEDSDPVYKKLEELYLAPFHECKRDNFSKNELWAMSVFAHDHRSMIECRKMKEEDYNRLLGADEKELIREALEWRKRVEENPMPPEKETEKITIDPLTLALQNLKFRRLSLRKRKRF